MFNGYLKFILVFAIALLVMLALRALAFTVYSVSGVGFAPEFVEGDHLLVNRWSYGLRTGDGQLFDYGRLWRQPVRRGDIVAFDDPRGDLGQRVLICRCQAVPGDTVDVAGVPTVVPGLVNCADQDYYWMEPIVDELWSNREDSQTFGFVPEQCIIGRVSCVLYSLIPQQSHDAWWKPFDANRFLIWK